ncbi:hypothetical protein, partial [Staphylococcus aureus]
MPEGAVVRSEPRFKKEFKLFEYSGQRQISGSLVMVNGH